MKPTELLPLLRQCFRTWNEANATTLGAALAYYAVFSVAPLAIIAVAIAGAVFGEQAARGELKKQLEKQSSPMVGQAVQEVINQANESGTGDLATLISGGILIVGAASLFTQLQAALNTIWKVQNKPGRVLLHIIRHRLFSFLAVLSTGLLLLAALGISVVLQGLDQFLSPAAVPGEFVLLRMWNWALSFALVCLLFAMIYKVLPDVALRWRDVWLGAVLTAVLFSLGNHLISLYIGRSSMASAYGAAGSLVVLLVWVYYSSQVFLFGAVFTHAYATRYGNPLAASPIGNPIAPQEQVPPTGR